MKLLITEIEDFSEVAIQELEKYFIVDKLDTFSKENVIKIINQFDAVFIRLGLLIDKEIIDEACNLKYILTATTGLDHIDVDYFEKNGGHVISLENEFEFLGAVPSTAEHTWALLLALTKKLPFAFQSVQAGIWNRNLFKGNNLKGKKIGILGLGRVGKQVAKFAEAFEMNIRYYDINIINSNYESFPSAVALFSWAEIITIHIPLNDSNVNFVNETLLKQCLHDVLLINTARGAIWNEQIIANLLTEGKIKGVATDVLATEYNNKTNPLVSLLGSNLNVIITPHIAGATLESMQMTEEFIAEKCVNLINFNNL